MPTTPTYGNQSGAFKLPSRSWHDFRNYLTGQKKTGKDLPDKQLSILKAGRSLPSPVASDLWRRRSK